MLLSSVNPSPVLFIFIFNSISSHLCLILLDSLFELYALVCAPLNALVLVLSPVLLTGLIFILVSPSLGYVFPGAPQKFRL